MTFFIRKGTIMAHSSTWAPIKSIRNGGPRDMRSSFSSTSGCSGRNSGSNPAILPNIVNKVKIAGTVYVTRGTKRVFKQVFPR